MSLLSCQNWNCSKICHLASFELPIGIISVKNSNLTSENTTKFDRTCQLATQKSPIGNFLRYINWLDKNKKSLSNIIWKYLIRHYKHRHEHFYVSQNSLVYLININKTFLSFYKYKTTKSKHKRKNKQTKPKIQMILLIKNTMETCQYYYKIPSVNIPLKLHQTNEQWEEKCHVWKITSFIRMKKHAYMSSYFFSFKETV